ncbi:MAG: translation initiation factor IF-2 [Candidatus Saganbacteria bacterium]|nr:translation initiation factor IF-2 [Candidatus Saganbacteria bacterium]
MAKTKVSELAKKLKLPAKELLAALKDLGVAAKTAASSVDEETAKVVSELLKPKAEVKAKPAPAKAGTEENPKPEAKPAKAEVKPAAVVPPPPPPPPPPPKEVKSSVPVIETGDISVKELAEKVQVKPSDLIKELMRKGILATMNQRIAAEVAKEVAATLGKEIALRTEKPAAAAQHDLKIEKRALRPPVVTVMGHVDHGKTKLLDAIRKTKVAEKEAGGITQHIGAYQVTVNGRKVTFLDTPGHEAFTSLRARGAKVTDIVVLVVAADDGVKPQTIEAIDHARAAGVPIIVAINKIDKPEANKDRVMTQLTELGLQAEEWGGQTVTVPVSAKQGTGIETLLEMILLLADVQELKADPHANPVGVIIESRIDKGRGAVATVLVKNGTLAIGDVFTCGATYGKVRALLTDTGARLEKAGPSTPAEVLGFMEVPVPGDLFEVKPSEKEARLLAEQKKEARAKVRRGKVVSLEDFSKLVKEGENVDLKLVVKADVQGSLDAIIKSLSDLKIGNIGVHIIHRGVGGINESDVMLAKASDAILVGFNVGFEGSAEKLGSDEAVEVRKYNIIYKLIDDVKLAMEGMLEPVFEEVITGHAEVRNLFSFSKVGTIAGCYVTDGKMTRGAGLRLFRNKEKIYEGKLESLKRFKDDVKSVETNFECGIAIPGYQDFKAGDVIETFETREKPRGK